MLGGVRDDPSALGASPLLRATLAEKEILIGARVGPLDSGRATESEDADGLHAEVASGG